VAEAGGRLYCRYARWEKYLRNDVRSLASAWSIRSRRPGFGGPRSKTISLGWYQALIEARIPFEMVHDRLLDAAHLSPFKTLILPNIAALSDAQCAQLRAFVQRGGGGLIATYETSLYDEWGVRRKDFGLAGPLGRRLQRAALKARCRTPICASKPISATGKRHPLLAGLEDAPRIINGVRRVEVEAAAGRSQQSALDSHPVVSRPADGEGLSARVEDRGAASLPP
jgi:hypothetical protein